MIFLSTPVAISFSSSKNTGVITCGSSAGGCSAGGSSAGGSSAGGSSAGGSSAGGSSAGGSSTGGSSAGGSSAGGSSAGGSSAGGSSAGGSSTGGLFPRSPPALPTSLSFPWLPSSPEISLLFSSELPAPASCSPLLGASSTDVSSFAEASARGLFPRSPPALPTSLSFPWLPSSPEISLSFS